MISLGELHQRIGGNKYATPNAADGELLLRDQPVEGPQTDAEGCSRFFAAELEFKLLGDSSRMSDY